MLPQSLPKLYALADASVLGEQLPAAVQAMVAAGVEWIQVRAKKVSGLAFYRLLERCVALAGPSTRLWIDDRVDLAALFPVAGVHLGQTDLPPQLARQILGPEPWIGQSTHNLEQVQRAAADPAVDVIALGPIFATQSKVDAQPVVGLEALAAARRITEKPLVAIGGMDLLRLPQALAAGAHVVAVLGAVCHGDVARNCAQLIAATRL